MIIKSGKLVFWVFVFLYVPFFYNFGLKYINVENVDFPSIYWGARVTFQERRSPYAENAFPKIEGNEAWGGRVFPYLYPPPSLIAFYPLSMLSYKAAKVLMLAVNHVCVLLFLYLILTKLLPENLGEPWREFAAAFYVLYVLVYDAVEVNLNHGQINLVVLMFLTLTWFALRNKHSHALSIALPLSVAILLKTYPLLFVPMLFFRKKYAALALTATLLATYAAIAYLVLPEVLWRDWVVNVLPNGGYGKIPVNLFSPAAYTNQSINGFVARLFQPNQFVNVPFPNNGLVPVVGYALAVIVGGVTVALSFFRSRKETARNETSNGILDFEFSMYLLMMYLVAPLSWDHHLVYLLPATLVTFNFIFTSDSTRLLRSTLLVPLFILAWKYPFDHGLLRNGLPILAISVKFYVILGIWSFFAYSIWKASMSKDKAHDYDLVVNRKLSNKTA